MKNFLSFVFIFFATRPVVSSLVSTPFGLRPKECVLEVPSGSHVEEDLLTDDLVITHPIHGTWRHKAAESCSSHAYSPKPHHLLASPSRSGSCQDPPCTCNSLPCNNWIDNAGWMLDPYNEGPYIGGFSAVMSVPQTPKNWKCTNNFLFPGCRKYKRKAKRRATKAKW